MYKRQRLGFAEDGTVSDARVAVCSLAPVPGRVPDAEAALIGSTLTPDVLEEAGAALLAAAAPIDDARSTANYRRRTLRGLLERATTYCQEESR